VLSLACWVEAGSGRPNLLGDAHMEKRLPTPVPSLLNRVAEQRHNLRKSLKKLCCDVESLSSLFRGDAVKTYRNRCEQMLQKLAV
jgi:hypothetical protein